MSAVLWGLLAITWPGWLLLAVAGLVERREAFRRAFPPPVAPEAQRPRRAL